MWCDAVHMLDPNHQADILSGTLRTSFFCQGLPVPVKKKMAGADTERVVWSIYTAEPSCAILVWNGAHCAWSQCVNGKRMLVDENGGDFILYSFVKHKNNYQLQTTPRHPNLKASFGCARCRQAKMGCINCNVCTPPTSPFAMLFD